jgi:hypothetical protein
LSRRAWREIRCRHMATGLERVAVDLLFQPAASPYPALLGATVCYSVSRAAIGQLIGVWTGHVPRSTVSADPGFHPYLAS